MRLDWEKQVEEFDAVWETRHQPPFIMENWVDNDWAKGRTGYLTFLIGVRDEKVIERINEIQSSLQEYECFEPYPDEYFHITVKELSCFLVSEKKNPDEYTKEELYQLVEKAKEKLEDFEPFELELKNLNNFKSNVIVQAHDGGYIRNINRALLEIPGVQKLQYDYPRFLPHVSIAQYRSSEDYTELINQLERVRETIVGPLRVDSIQLVIAHLPKQGRYPRLETLEELPL